MSWKKRGISPIVATVLLVLLTMTAALIIAGILIPFTKKNLNESTSCVAYSNYFKFDESFDTNYNCYNATSKLHGFSVRASNENLSSQIIGFEVLFLKGGISEKASARDGDDVGTATGQIRMLEPSISNITIPKEGGVKTYVYQGTDSFTDVEIYPVLKTGKSCDKSDRIKLLSCDDVGTAI